MWDLDGRDESVLLVTDEGYPDLRNLGVERVRVLGCSHSYLQAEVLEALQSPASDLVLERDLQEVKTRHENLALLHLKH